PAGGAGVGDAAAEAHRVAASSAPPVAEPFPRIGRVGKNRGAGSAAGSTPATVALTKAGISFEIRSYAHDPSVTDFGGEAAAALGVDASRVFKTLLAEVDGALAVGIVPVSGRLDLKALASVLGGRRASMADPAVAERR